MKGTKQITTCRECGSFWDDGAGPMCVDSAHTRTTHVLHVHEDEVVTPDGTRIVAASYEGRYERDIRPDFGLYLDRRWSPPWPHEHVDWPDFGLPSDVGAFRRQLDELLTRARDGQRVEVGCLGGHGRTGTLLACASALCGRDADTATDRVRSAYCQGAVETPEQEAFVHSFLAAG